MKSIYLSISHTIRQSRHLSSPLNQYSLVMDDTIVMELAYIAHVRALYDSRQEGVRLLTCHTCLSRGTCEFAFDPYNTDGDCLAIK